MFFFATGDTYWSFCGMVFFARPQTCFCIPYLPTMAIFNSDITHFGTSISLATVMSPDLLPAVPLFVHDRKQSKNALQTFWISLLLHHNIIEVTSTTYDAIFVKYLTAYTFQLIKRFSALPFSTNNRFYSAFHFTFTDLLLETPVWKTCCSLAVIKQCAFIILDSMFVQNINFFIALYSSHINFGANYISLKTF